MCCTIFLIPIQCQLAHIYYFRTHNTNLIMCGDFCPIPGHNTDAKYNKLAPDLNILNKFIFLRQIYFTYNIHT